MITFTADFSIEGMLFYLCITSTLFIFFAISGILLKVWQLFGKPNK